MKLLFCIHYCVTAVKTCVLCVDSARGHELENEVIKYVENRCIFYDFIFSEFRFTVPIFIELGTITGAVESHHINPEALGVTTLGVRDWYSGTGVTRAEAGLRLQLRLWMFRLLHNSDYYADMRKTR